MPMELARCPTCGEGIGGQHHRPTAGVQHASDIEERFVFYSHREKETCLVVRGKVRPSAKQLYGFRRLRCTARQGGPQARHSVFFQRLLEDSAAEAK
ncbi:hypothetical protein KC365_g101 [Hortaea werneckii]|nr:hypothetical protein KC365_g101 [Hortaea werneckii]